jgi:hypothetical protein
MTNRLMVDEKVFSTGLQRKYAAISLMMRVISEAYRMKANVLFSICGAE